MSVAASTRKTYRAALRALDKWLDGRALTDSVLADYVVHLHQDQGKAPSTISTALAGVKFRESAMGRPDPIGPETRRMRRMYRREGVGRGKGSAPGLTLEQIEKVIRQTEAVKTIWGPRDAALLALMFYSGLRSAEIPGLKVSDLRVREDGRGVVVIRQSKGDQYGRGAVAPYPIPAQERVRHWLKVSGIESGPIFPAIQTNGLGGAPPTITRRPMHKIHAARIVKGRAAAAGFRITSHSMRRSFAQYLSAIGLSDHQIAEAGRWSDTSMVLRYTRGTSSTMDAVLDAFNKA